MGMRRLVFLDPPFDSPLLEPALLAAARIVAAGGFVYTEVRDAAGRGRSAQAAGWRLSLGACRCRSLRPWRAPTSLGRRGTPLGGDRNGRQRRRWRESQGARAAAYTAPDTGRP
jgi:hypothetical protein